MINRATQQPGRSEIESIPPDILDDSMNVVTNLFHHHRFCYAVKFNVKRITIKSRFADGMGKTGSMEWEVKVQPNESTYPLSAFVNLDWDDDMIKIPAVFVDNQNNARGFSEVSIRRFLYAGVDLSEHIPPGMPRL